MVRPTKQFKRFASSGKLSETIKNRRATQQKKKRFDSKVEQRKRQRDAPRPEHQAGSDSEEDEDDAADAKAANGARGGKAGGVAKTVDELFGAGGLDVPIEEGSDLEDLSEDEEDEDDDEEEEDVQEDEDMDEDAMARAMAELEKKDPEFFKHLKAEDPNLLSFGKGKGRADEMDEDEDEDAEMDSDDEMMDEDDEAPAVKKVVVTMKMLRLWRESMIKVGGRFDSTNPTATLCPFAPQDAPCIPRCRPHERGRWRAGSRSGVEVHHPQC